MTNKTKSNDDKEITRMLMEQLEKESSINVEEVIEYPPVSLSLGTYTETNFDGTTSEYPIPIFTDGNLSVIQAFPKVGKSFFTSLLVSAYQSGSNKFSGKIKGHRKGRKIIHFDTEQGLYHASKLAKRPLIMNDIKNDENYHFYALRSMSSKSRVEFIEYILFDKFEDEEIGLIIIDGVADLLLDVNSMEQSNIVIQKLMEYSTKLSCHISTVIHQNFGTSKATGNLGSALEKKVECQISLEKNHINKGWVTVECKRSRNRGFETFSFTINENGLPEFVENEVPEF